MYQSVGQVTLTAKLNPGSTWMSGLVLHPNRPLTAWSKSTKKKRCKKSKSKIKNQKSKIKNQKNKVSCRWSWAGGG
jgi:hypothetical protein